ncbi:MiaB/RimO family radical SAM methylthiotransferase [Olsenella uli]|uniref:MiaB/RimO family radical SAM methylthiotransferase n=1 Tax=Olsenella uli TaxID=133926 RepID=UPI00195A9D74|nr:MiaB/RimO family radical SAM methylthiotransferase [Olsenella uli]
MREARGVALVNLGCRVNRVELDRMALDLEAAGATLVGERDADVVIVNTCAVTGEAEAKTRKAVRRAASLPGAPLVIATGCVANLFADELAALAPNVRVEKDKGAVAELAVRALGLAGDAAERPAAQTPTPTGRTRPGIMIQDGCDNRCTYCIVWRARGAARSLAPEKVLASVLAAQGRGANEVVLTGINLGSYRAADESGRELGLPALLDLVLSRTSVGRIRLSSIEPPDVTPELCSVMAAAGDRVAPFLHVCLQSGCDDTLRRMARVYRTADFRRVVETARERLPHLALGTDLIVGFPGESDDDFERSLAFCREMRFAKMHVFRYSRRPGTPAATMAGQVDPHVMAARGERARALADELRLAEARRLVGGRDLVVVQSPGRGVTGGLFDVLLDSSVPVDSLVPVRLTGARDDATLTAELL